jgi:hypothetical protein
VKVLMVSTSYPENASDWRGRFIHNLAAGLGRQQAIQLQLWAPPGDLPPGVAADATQRDREWLRQLAYQGGIAHLLRGNKLRAIGAAGGLLRRLHGVYRRNTVDLVHVNWLQNALPLWGTKTPALVTVLGTDFGLLRLPGMSTLLRAVFKQRSTILAPNAQWMVPTLNRLFGDIAEVRPVSFGIDQAWFDLKRQPNEGGPTHWLAITRLTKNKIGDLFDWGEGLFGTNRVLHLFGPMQEQLELPPWVQYHGPTHPEALLTQWFPRATGLITLSRHDEGRPQVMLEAMAAGLPIVASNLAAHADFIADHQNGWIVETVEDFREALAQMEMEHLNRSIGDAARDWALQAVGTWDDCAKRYAKLYGELLVARA